MELNQYKSELAEYVQYWASLACYETEKQGFDTLLSHIESGYFDDEIHDCWVEEQGVQEPDFESCYYMLKHEMAYIPC